MGSSATNPDAGPLGSDSAAEGDAVTAAPDTDGGTHEDAGLIEVLDGGSNLDLDAGEDLGDGGVELVDVGDGGVLACNALPMTSTSLTTTCISSYAVPFGGAIVAGTYALAAVKVIGSSAFCSGAFSSSQVQGSLQVLARGGATGFGVRRVTQFGAIPTPVRRNDSMLPGANDTSPLSWTPTCPTGLATSVEYSTYVKGAHQFLELILPWGRGKAIYHYVM